jgi:Co/Zn/Cd efflux system component
MLGLGATLALAALWSSWQQLQLVEDLARGANVADAAIEANDGRQQLFAYAELGLGIASAVVFLMWTSAHTKRLIALGVTNMQYAPKWSVWGFIIPILNLFRPYQVMSELWRASEVVPGPDDPWVKKATPAIVYVWFGVLVVDNIVGRLASRTSFDTIDQILQAAWLTVLTDALGVITALVALRLVVAIDERLRVSETRLAEAPAAAAVMPAL